MFERMAILPLAPFESPKQQRIADKPLSWRLARVAMATTVMLLAIVGLVWSRDRLGIPQLFGVRAGLVAGVVIQSALLATVLTLAAIFVGLGELRLRLRGAVVSMLLIAPLLLISFADAPGAKFPGALELVVVILYATLIALTEEIYARGMLVTLFGGRRWARLAIIGSSLCFAYMHLPSYSSMFGWEQAWIRSTSSAVFSGIAAIVVLRSGSLVGVIVFHAINDTQAILGGFGSESSGTMSFKPIVFGGVLVAIYWLATRRAILQKSEA